MSFHLRRRPIPLRLSLVWLLACLLGALALVYSYLDLREISGTVRDAAGHPIPGAAISLAGRSTPAHEAGHFRLQASRGAFPLIAYADGYEPGEQIVMADDLFQKQYLAEPVLSTNALTANVVTAKGAPVPGATVRLVGAATDPQETATDSLGQFIFHGVKRGARLELAAPGYRPAAYTYTPPGEAQYQLTPALTHIALTDEFTGKPLPDVQVRAADGQVVRTDGAGRAVFTALAPNLTVSTAPAGYAPATVTYTGEEELALALTPTTLDVTVLDAASRQPISNARLFLDNEMLLTDSQGKYHFDHAAGVMTLQVKSPGYRLTSFPISRTAQADLALPPFKAKGIHIYYAMPRDAVLALLERLRGTEVNAVVLDVKEGAGDVVWPSEVKLAREIGAFHERGIPPAELISLCREWNWYCIARMVVFKDTRLGNARPDWALHFPGGGVLQTGGEIWMNPARKEVWDYDLALAAELSRLGFDEVQFDYIRYPGSPTPLEFGDTETRLELIRQFLETASNTFRALPAFLSADVFGLTTATKDEQGIGQRLEIDAPYLDYLSPMLYPSTWKGSPSLFQIGLRNYSCTAALACPYQIIYQGTVIGRERGKVLVRPWLQAYGDVGFGVLQYIEQRKGADAADSAGWLFWNNQGNYPDAMFERQ